MEKLVNGLYAKVRKILLQDWDPIGVVDIPEAQDEYDIYVADICEILCGSQIDLKVYDYLCWVETERMGLDFDVAHNKNIAKKLVGLL